MVPLVLGTNGNFYGTTSYGGISAAHLDCSAGCGTVFEVTPTGQLTTLHTFCAKTNCADGDQPQAGLALGNDGNFYGTTQLGGSMGDGTVFKVTPTGTLTTLHSFCTQTSGNGNCLDGGEPTAGLVQGADGNFYGATLTYGVNSAGTIFKISPSGTLTTLYSFCSQKSAGGFCLDGQNPSGGLVQGTDGNFYGITNYGGANAHYECCGTVFQITPAGTLTTLHSFCSDMSGETCADGQLPYAGLTQATNGNFYGGTTYGGTPSNLCGKGGCGVVFSLSMGLTPFVEAVPAFGSTGRTIGILGNDLTGTTSVTFNGISATFTVLSGTVITAKVPAGATTGAIEVTTPSGTLQSNVSFHVLP